MPTHDALLDRLRRELQEAENAVARDPEDRDARRRLNEVAARRPTAAPLPARIARPSTPAARSSLPDRAGLRHAVVIRATPRG
jgi:hypothetical protein